MFDDTVWQAAAELAHLMSAESDASLVDPKYSYCPDIKV
jgi:hypothetical protein